MSQPSPPIARLDGVVGDGLAAIAPDGLLQPIVLVAAEGGIDGAVVLLHSAPGKGDVGAMERAGAAVIGELRREVGHGRLGLGGDHDARGVLVEPVDDAGALDAVDAGEAARAVKQQGVDQRAAGAAGRGVDDHADGLVDDDQLRRPRRGCRAGCPRARDRRSSGGGAVRSSVSPGLTLVFGSAAVCPLIAAAPASIRSLMRLREKAGSALASTASSRPPARAASTSTSNSSSSASDACMSDPNSGDAPLTPEARAMIGRARRCFLLSIGLLLVGLIAVGGVIVYKSSAEGGAHIVLGRGLCAGVGENAGGRGDGVGRRGGRQAHRDVPQRGDDKHQDFRWPDRAS